MSFARRALKPVAQYGAAAAYRQVRSRTRQRRGLGDAIADLFVSRAIEGAKMTRRRFVDKSRGRKGRGIRSDGIRR